MFAKIAHQLQFFSLLLILLATIEHKPFIKLLSETHNTLLLCALVGLSFVLSLGNRTLIKSSMLTLGLTLGFLLTANTIYLFPTLGVLVLCLFTLAFFHLLDRNHSLIQNSKVTWINLFLSFLLLLVFSLVASKVKNNNSAVYNLALIFASLSVIHLGFKNLDRYLKFNFYFVTGLGILGLLLFFTHNYKLLELFTTINLILSLIHFGFVSFKARAKIAAETHYEAIFAKPEPIVIGYFLILAIIGTFLLQLPLAQGSLINKHGLIDSFFTAISAVCVTGLVIFDTSKDFTSFGQLVILLLIQLGGLGITTLSAWILMILSSGRLSLTHEDTIKSMSGHRTKIDIKSFLKRIVWYFFIVEALGALLLFLSFLKYHTWSFALWAGIFTSISAFCNAGFALSADSLIRYQENSFILIIISFLIIAGGFAPLMALDIFQNFRRPRWSVQEKVVLSSTLVLLVFGFLFFLFVEWSESMKGLSTAAKFTNAWLQSASTRTAGFNSVDLAETRSVTQLFFMLLMFIGGNPGSTAGGIKTVTIAVLAFTAISALKDQDEVVAFSKKIPHRTIYRASLIVFFSFGLHFIVFFFLSMTQTINPISLMFETFSALGTVGLSVGATVQLDEIGKIIIIFSMLAGRVGPLTFVLLLLKRSAKPKWKTVEEDVFIS